MININAGCNVSLVSCMENLELFPPEVNPNPLDGAQYLVLMHWLCDEERIKTEGYKPDFFIAVRHDDEWWVYKWKFENVIEECDLGCHLNVTFSRPSRPDCFEEILGWVPLFGAR